MDRTLTATTAGLIIIFTRAIDLSELSKHVCIHVCIYVCVYVYMYIYNVYLYTNIYTHVHVYAIYFYTYIIIPMCSMYVLPSARTQLTMHWKYVCRSGDTVCAQRRILRRISSLTRAASAFAAQFTVRKVLKDFRWFIRHHSSVMESAAH